MSELHVNHKYLVHVAEKRAPGGRGRILDLGCGRGEVVEEGLRRGLDIHGADLFYGARDPRSFSAGQGPLAHRIREIADGRIPFEDGHFDLVVSNQVLEHVVDLDAVLSEIHRVLKSGGQFRALFPSREVIREGHCGIPAVHWLKRGSRLRYHYTLALRRAGLGLYKGDMTAEEWTEHNLARLDDLTFYRPRRSILASFRTFFRTTLVEEDYVVFRLRDRRHTLAAKVYQFPGIRTMGNELFRRLAGLVIRAEKP